MKMLVSQTTSTSQSDLNLNARSHKIYPHPSKYIFLAASLNNCHLEHSIKLAKKRGDFLHKSLHVVFKRMDPSLLSKRSFKLLTNHLSKGHHIASLTLSSLMPTYPSLHSTNLIFSNLQSLLKANPRLKKLSLDLYNVCFSSQEALMLTSGLLGLKMLECLSFSVKQLPDFDNHVRYLARGLRALINLVSLKIHAGKKNEESCAKLLVYTQPTLGSSLLERISSFLPSMNKLEEFHFYASRELEDRAIENLLFALPEMKHLKSFYYEPYATKFTMLQMLEPLSDLGSLKSFGFNFSTVEDDSTTEELTYFSMLTDLKELKAIFKSVPVRKIMSLISLLKTAASFESLETLVLEFEFNEEILEYLGEENDIDILDTLFHNLSSSLKRVKLTISNTCNRGFELISNALQNLPHLKFLSITLKNCRLLNDKPFTSFAEAFASFQGMEHFYLEMQACPYVTDNAMIPLQNGLEHLSSLKWLGFSFVACTRITGKSLGHIKGAFANLVHLETLNIEYQSCKNVSDGLFKHLKGLYELKNLNTLYLTVKKCPKVSEQGMCLLGEIIRGLRNLRELYFKPGMDVAKNLLSTFLNRVDLIASLYSEEEQTAIQVD